MINIWKDECSDIWKKNKIVEFSDFIKSKQQNMVGELFENVEHKKMKSWISLVGLLKMEIFEKRVDELSEIEQIRLFVLFGIIYQRQVGIDFDKSLDNSPRMLIFVFQKMYERFEYDINICTVQYLDEISEYCHNIIYHTCKDGNAQIEKAKSLYRLSNLSEDIVLRPCNEDDYLSMKKFHYVKDDIENSLYLTGAYYNGILIGCDVVNSPLAGFAPETIQKNEVLKYIDENIISSVRLITHPDYRGLSVASRLINYVKENAKYEIFETRSVIFRGTKVMEHWGGKYIAREYRKKHEAYDELVKNIEAIGESLKDIERIVQNEQFLYNEEKFKTLIKQRLYEVDAYQYRYFSDLVRLKRTYSEETYEHAKQIYTEKYQNEYDVMFSEGKFKELLNFCKLWESDAYILNMR